MENLGLWLICLVCGLGASWAIPRIAGLPALARWPAKVVIYFVAYLGVAGAISIPFNAATGREPSDFFTPLFAVALVVIWVLAKFFANRMDSKPRAYVGTP